MVNWKVKRKRYKVGARGVMRNILEKCSFFVTDRQTDNEEFWCLTGPAGVNWKVGIKHYKQTNKHFVIIYSSTSPLLFQAAM